MIQTSFENKVQIQDILNNQIPEFISSENPKFSEFLKQYYVSQEISGGNVDIVENLPYYLKLDNFTSKILNGTTNLTQNVTTTLENGITPEIFVADTEGFPKNYGLLQIGSEIITYKSKTPTSFVDCIRNFSGIDEYGKNLNFSSTNISSHTSGSEVINLSVLFLKEFYSKIKTSLLNELETTDLYEGLDVNKFLKNTTSLYRSKGSSESFRILFKSLFNIEPQIIDLENYVIKSSNSDFRRRKELLTELISTGNPSNIVGQQLFKNTNPDIFGSISEIEILTKNGLTFYRILLYVGFEESSDELTSVFAPTPSTKLVDSINLSDNANVLTVDSTIGFEESGSVFYAGTEIFYTEKTINQFLGCYTATSNYIDLDIVKTSNLHSNSTYYAYENGDSTKKVEFRLLGSLSDIFLDTFNNKTHINSIGETISVDSFGKNIKNTDNNTRDQIISNSLIYNTSVRVELDSVNFQGSTATTSTTLDRAFLKVGDKVEFLKRNTEIVETALSDVSVIDILDNEITFSSGLSSLNSFGSYDIRRKLDFAQSIQVPLKYNNLTTNITNLYDENSENLYIASNSLPSYDITKNVVKSTVNSIENYDAIQNSYTTIRFDSVSSFINGDKVFYSYTGENPINGLEKREYYVTISNLRDIKLYLSPSSIPTDNFIYLGSNVIPEGTHTFTLSDQITSTNKISPSKSFKKIPSHVNLSTFGEKIKSKPIGMLVNGVEILGPVSNSKIYYGPLEKLDIINSGSGYDVINPPNLNLESGSAKIQPILQGSIEKVYVDNINFESDSPIVTVSGGNGKNAKLKANTKTFSREVFFNARPLSDGGGLSFVNETITFLTDHNFYSGEKVFYDINDINNKKIGISNFGGLNVSTSYLNNNTPFFVKVINPSTIELYPTLSDFRSGINTVGLSTEGNSGIHKFKTEPRNVISSIIVENPGEGFTNRKLTVSQSGISTINDTITFKNHGFSSGELVTYDFETSSISGISTTNQYYILKVNDDSFRVCNAGIGGTDSSFYSREKYVSIGSSGSGYQYFNYPDINVQISYVSNGEQVASNIVTTPVVKGSIIDAYLYEKGSDYGSTLLNIEESPRITIQQGKEASFTPVVTSAGKLDRVIVNYGGYDYYSVPELQVISNKGIGAILRAEISNNTVSTVHVIESGANYSFDDIKIIPVFSGKNAIINARIRTLTVDNSYKYGIQYSDRRDPSYEFLHKNINNELQYVVSGYSDLLKNEFNDNETSHSSIIGWAYDGNPIYGPFGYKDPENPSIIKRLVSGYNKSVSNVTNRPTNSEFPEGYFIDDYKFDDSGDLDLHNGRWCKTPEFPNGVYAYFATAILNSNNENIGSFPYFIGTNYRSKLVSDNNDNILNQSFDFQNSSLFRNTFPYKVQDAYAGYDFFPSNSSTNSQVVEITSVTKGSIDSYEIVDSGSNFKVGDTLNFKNSTSSSGYGFLSEVSSIYGKQIDTIENNYIKYTNAKIYSTNSSSSFIRILPSHNIVNNTVISITGLTTNFEPLNGDYVAEVDTFATRLSEAIPSYDPNAQSGTHHPNVTGIVTDIKLENFPKIVSIGSSIEIKGESTDQYFTILNYFSDKKIVRCRKTGVSGASTSLSTVNFLPSIIRINSNIKSNNNIENYKRYFNPAQSIGVGTVSGITFSRSFSLGSELITKNIPTQSIYLPNHGFHTGQEVLLHKGSTNSGSIIVQDDPIAESPVASLLSSSLPEKIYIINKSKDYIGIVTSSNLTNTTNGLYFPSNVGSDNYDYYFESTYNEEISTVYQNLTTVSISTSHNLTSGDLIDLKVSPNLNVGVGNTTFVDVKYIPEINSLSLRTIGFSTLTDIDINTNSISIENHLLSSGDKVYYISTSTPSGLNEEVYYVNKVDVDTIRLSETYKDSISELPRLVSINSVGIGTQEILVIQPDINLVRNNNLVFDLSDSSLENYKLNLFYDEDLKREFISVPNTLEFSTSGVGTVGVSSEASLTLRYNDNLPNVLYYSLVDGKSKVITTSYNSKILLKNSEYSGKYSISNVQDTKFDIFLDNVPERLSYTKADCSTLEYTTNSLTGIGSVHDLKIISEGNLYDNVPYYSGSNSKNGTGLLVVLRSKSAGKLTDYEELNYGYEYSVDTTISPSLKTSQNVSLFNSQFLKSVEVVDGGSGYPNAPSLIVVDSDTGKKIDRGLITAKISGSGIGNANITAVEISAQVTGLPARQVSIKAVNNANGIRIIEVDSSTNGIMTCLLKTPILGYVEDPFEVGDKVFVEDIQTVEDTGIGFNSEDHGFEFFNVIDYTSNSNPGEVTIQIPKLFGNPGIAVKYQIDSFATMIKSTDYPSFVAKQEYSLFFLEEEIFILDESGVLVETGLIVGKVNADYLKLIGSYKLNSGDTIIGKSSGFRANIFDSSSISGYYLISGASTKDYGWDSDSGKTNVDTQSISDNDYYQNLSYTVKSEKTWDEIKTPINTIVHPIGTKNFADTQIQQNVAGILTTGLVNSSIVESLQSFVSQTRVDTIKNFDVVTDFDVINDRSKFIRFKNVKLSDYFLSQSNRVLQIDDISPLFSSEDDEEFDTNLIIKSLSDRRYFYKTLVQVKTTDNSISNGYNHLAYFEIISLYDGVDNVYSLDRLSHNNNSNSETYVSISPVATDTGDLDLYFYPKNPYDIDYEIKVFQEKHINFDDRENSFVLDSADIFVNQINVGTKTTEDLITSYDLTVYDSIMVEAHVVDLDTNQSKYYEIVSLYDGTEFTFSELNFESSDTDISSIGLGTFGIKKSSNNLNLSFYCDEISNTLVRTKSYQFKSSPVGVGTYRFKSTRQEDSSERTVVLDTSVYNTGTGVGIVTTRYYDRELFSTIKTLARVSIGNTVSLHQIVNIQDNENSYIVEGPITSIGNTMGVFKTSLDQNNLKLEFERNDEYSNSNLTITQLDYSFYTFLDEINIPLDLDIASLNKSFSVARYFGVNSTQRNRLQFPLKYNNIPIFSKSFDPFDGTKFNPTTGIFTLNDHFFSTGERLIYTPKSTFIGLGNSAIHTSSNVGLSTEVYAIKIDNDSFKVASSKSNANSGTAIQFSSYLGEGNAHEFEMYKKNEKSLITINNLAQYPLLYSDVTHTISNKNIDIADNFITLSGISSINPDDIIKVNDEYMKVLNVGIGTSTSGPILYFSGDLNILEVSRGNAGSAATSHVIGDTASLYRGSYNIAGDSIYFTNPPRGNVGDLSTKDESNLLRERASFSGRTFLRKNYATNEIFDDFSNNFDGKTTTFELTTQGISTVGLGTTSGNGVLFINGIFQTPLTENITNHNFEILSDIPAGISSVVFSGLRDNLNALTISDSDINQNQLPRGGIIVSLGSTAGLGYAPLVGAKVKLNIDENGTILNPVVSIASTGKTVAITTASYDNNLGQLTITSPQEEIYKLVESKANQVKLVGLSFTCNSNPGIASEFPLHYDVTDITGIGTESFTLNVGISTLEHYYVGYGTVFVWNSGLTNGSGYRPDTASVSVRDAAEDYVHKFVGSDENSIQSGGSNFTPTFATYDPVTGNMVLVIKNHGLDTNDDITVTTGSLNFTCSSDGHKFVIGYPRATDPLAGIATDITAYTDDTITIDAGSMVGSGGVVDVTVGLGGTLSFNVSNGGTNYTYPILNISNPSYDNLEVVGVSRLGVGATTEVGINMLMNVEVGPSSGIDESGSVGIGSTLFEVSSFSVARAGYAFETGDVLTVSGLVTDRYLSEPIEKFQLYVLDTYNDNVAAWQFGEMNLIDNIRPYQDGSRLVYPLYYETELLSFAKDPDDLTSSEIDFNSLLVIFINGILQEPGVAYQFVGGSSFRFLTAPKVEDDVKIYFYVGTRNEDSLRVDVNEIVQVGDTLQIQSNNSYLNITKQQDKRLIYDIVNADILETNLYYGDGIDEINFKPVDWIKQKEDVVINQQTYYKSRDSLATQIYPTAKIITDFNTTDTVLYLDNSEFFDYEDSVNLSKINVLIVPNQDSNKVGIITAIVSDEGTISSFNIIDSGIGYTGAPSIKISNPIIGIGSGRKWYDVGIGTPGDVGIGTTAIASVTVSNGNINSVTVINSGSGYTSTNPPQVILDFPTFESELLTDANVVQGLSGSIVGIATTTGTNGAPLALEFTLKAFNDDYTSITEGIPIHIFDTKIGNGVTSINDNNDTQIIGISTQFLDNIYKVHGIDTLTGIITCNVKSDTNISGEVGIGTTGTATNPVGKFSWGKISGFTRSSNPISIAVTSYTTSGLGTYPTVQRRGAGAGLRDTGSLKKKTTST